MKKVLTKKFFEKRTRAVAEELLGKILCRKIGSRVIKHVVTEVEVYDGFNDKASHASRGKTARNFPMFGPAGVWYIYFCYGAHWMLNIVTGPKDYPAAVLIRGLVAVSNNSMLSNRKILSGTHIPLLRDCSARAAALRKVRQNIAVRKLNGPGKLTKFLKIDKKFNNMPATKKTGLWIEDGGFHINPSQIIRAKRIGVDYADKWALKPYRFMLNLNQYERSNKGGA